MFSLVQGDTEQYPYLPAGYPTSLTDTSGEVIKNPLELSGQKGKSVNFLDVTIRVTEAGLLDYQLYDKRCHLEANGSKLSFWMRQWDEH